MSLDSYVYGTRPHVPDYMLFDEDGAGPATPSTYRLITDHLGCMRLAVNAQTGTVAQRLRYDAYGRLLQDDTLIPDFAQPFGFAGGLHDRATGPPSGDSGGRSSKVPFLNAKSAVISRKRKDETPSPHSVPAQRPCTASPHSVPAQRPCTASLHSVPAQRPCTASPHSVPAQRPRTASPHLLVPI